MVFTVPRMAGSGMISSIASALKSPRLRALNYQFRESRGSPGGCDMNGRKSSHVHSSGELSQPKHAFARIRWPQRHFSVIPNLLLYGDADLFTCGETRFRNDTGSSHA